MQPFINRLRTMKRQKTFYIAMALMASVLAIGPAKAQAQFPRTVLLEEFTSITCKPCTTATPLVNKVIKEKNGRVVSVRYHMNIPLAGDPWYNANPEHNGKRAQYYDKQMGLPYGRFDGATIVSVTSEGDVFDKADDRLEKESPIQLQVTQTRTENHFSVQVTAKSGTQALDGDYRLHVVAVEAHIYDDRYQGGFWNNEKEFEDVMRTLVTGPDGEEFSIGGDEEKSRTFSYQLGDAWQADQMYVVAFVQNDFTKEVVQAGYSPKPVSSVRETPAIAGYALAQSFPNPARSEAAIGYTLGRGGDVVLKLYNAAGELVATYHEGMKEAGTYQARVELAGLPAGAYTYTLRSGAYRASHQITVVK